MDCVVQTHTHTHTHTQQKPFHSIQSIRFSLKKCEQSNTLIMFLLSNLSFEIKKHVVVVLLV